MVIRWTVSMESSWWKHRRRKTSTFSTSMFKRKMQMWQNLWMKELCFGTKALTTSTWWVSRSWKKWSMAWTWKKCHCTMCAKLALKANIKGHVFLKMKQLGLQSLWRLTYRCLQTNEQNILWWSTIFCHFPWWLFDKNSCIAFENKRRGVWQIQSIQGVGA